MEELKLLIGMVTDLPSMALWVLIGYLVYKLAVLGSIYGTIRFCTEKAVEAYKKEKVTVYAWKEGVEPINEDVKNRIITSLIRLKGSPSSSGLAYVHSDFAELLEKLVNDHISATPAKK